MSSITCGNCGQTHPSILTVQGCYAHTRYSGAVRAERAVAATRPARPRFARQPGAQPLSEGIYAVGDKVFKVYPALNGGHLLAKELELQGLAKKPTWVYRGAATRFVQADQQMTHEQAVKFGKITGVCAMCGRTLTDESSIAAGIGPICANRVSF